jgi:hypothetical protein
MLPSCSAPPARRECVEEPDSGRAPGSAAAASAVRVSEAPDGCGVQSRAGKRRTAGGCRCDADRVAGLVVVMMMSGWAGKGLSGCFLARVYGGAGAGWRALALQEEYGAGGDDRASPLLSSTDDVSNLMARLMSSSASTNPGKREALTLRAS